MNPISNSRTSGCRQVLLACALGILMTSCAGSGLVAQDLGGDRLQISVVFNNVPSALGLETAWGFAAVIEGLDQTLLFDTGGNGDLLLANMKQMGIDPGEIDAVFLSHFHSDHIRGLGPFLRRNPNVTVFMPASFPRHFQESTRKSGARVVPVPARLHRFPVRSTHSSGRCVLAWQPSMRGSPIQPSLRPRAGMRQRSLRNARPAWTNLHCARIPCSCGSRRPLRYGMRLRTPLWKNPGPWLPSAHVGFLHRHTSLKRSLRTTRQGGVAVMDSIQRV